MLATYLQKEKKKGTSIRVHENTLYCNPNLKHTATDMEKKGERARDNDKKIINKKIIKKPQIMQSKKYIS